MNVQVRLPGTEHWTNKGDVKLFLWNKCRGRSGQDRGHDPVRARLLDGLAADLRPAGAGPAGFLGDGLVRQAAASTAGASTWRATAAPPRTATTTRRSRTAPTTASPPRPTSRSCAAATPLLVYGISSGALRAALFAERHPETGRRASRSTPWCGPAKARRRLPSGARSCPSSVQETAGRSTKRLHPFDLRPRPSRHRRATTSSRPSPTRSCALDDSVPTGTYVDMCSKLPVVDPGEDHGADADHARPVGRHRRLRRPDRSSSSKLPNPDKQFAVMPGISHASFQQKNYMMVYHILLSFFSQPAPVYRG